MKHRPAIGREWPDVEVIEAQRNFEKERTRSFIARWIVTACLVALIGVGAVDTISGSAHYTSTLAVWGIVGPAIFAVVGHYFGVRRTKEE